MAVVKRSRLLNRKTTTMVGWIASHIVLIAGSFLIYAQVDGEEAILTDRFGDEYREYMKQTPRFLPNLVMLSRTRMLPTDTNED